MGCRLVCETRHCRANASSLPLMPAAWLYRALTEEDIQPQLTRRRPGQSRLTTPRAEKDLVTILSGTEFGYTLGTPIGLLVKNEDQRPGDYKEMSAVPRPGHADFTYQIKCEPPPGLRHAHPHAAQVNVTNCVNDPGMAIVRALVAAAPRRVRPSGELQPAPLPKNGSTRRTVARSVVGCCSA